MVNNTEIIYGSTVSCWSTLLVVLTYLWAWDTTVCLWLESGDLQWCSDWSSRPTWNGPHILFIHMQGVEQHTSTVGKMIGSFSCCYHRTCCPEFVNTTEILWNCPVPIIIMMYWSRLLSLYWWIFDIAKTDIKKQYLNFDSFYLRKSKYDHGNIFISAERWDSQLSNGIRVCWGLYNCLDR